MLVGLDGEPSRRELIEQHGNDTPIAWVKRGSRFVEKLATPDISVADLLRNTSFNSFGSFRPQSGSSATSFAGLSLRAIIIIG